MEWSLPGPSGFIRKAIEKLKDRKNLIFMLPEDFDTRPLCQTLRRAVRESGLDLWWEERSVSVLIKDHHAQPGESITQAFGLQSDDPAAIHDAGFVAQSNNFSDLVIYLEGWNELDESDRQNWMRFLADYAYACGERDNRSLFCVPLVGTLAFEDIPKDVFLEHLWWWGIVSRWDVMQYIHSVSSVNTLESTWKNAIVAELAGWDLDLVDKLIQFDDQSFANIENIFNCLVGYAYEKGWNNTNLKNLNQITLMNTQNSKPFISGSDLWGKGILNLIHSDECNDYPSVHPAVLVARQGQETLKRLIRKGQSRSVLLTIDEQRLAVCEYLRARHGKDWHYWCEGEYNKGHYEIGEIGHLLYLFNHANNAEQLPRYDSDLSHIRELVNWMKNARDDLSHLKHLDFGRIKTGARLIERARPYLRKR